MKSFVLAIISLLFATVAVAQSQYSVRPGDTLSVEVLEDPSLNRNLLVLPDGTVSFPFAGSINAGGRTAGQIQSAITSGIASNFASTPNVFVTVQSLGERTSRAVAPRTIDIYFIGEVNAPGEKEMERGTTLLQALATSGGFTKFAATKRIQLRRTAADGSTQMARINYKAIADGAAVDNDIVLQDGDVIIVPERRLFE